MHGLTSIDISAICRSSSAFYFEISFLQLLFLDQLPEIILNDGITWCFITSSPTPLVKASYPLKAFPVWTTCVSRFFTWVLNNPLKHLLNLAPLSRRRWLLVVGTSKIPVVAVGFLVLQTLVEISPITIGISVSTLVSRPLETCSTNEVHFSSSSLPSVSTASASSTKQASFLRSLWTLSSFVFTSSIWSFPRMVADFLLSKSVFLVLLLDARFQWPLLPL